jgi:hypothetical protein
MLLEHAQQLGLEVHGDFRDFKAPFSWPNSSLSSKPSGRAAQLTAMKGLSLRSLCWWMYRAKSSFPVPLSPWMRTLALLAAMRRARCVRSSMAGLPAMMARAAPAPHAVAGAARFASSSMVLASRSSGMGFTQ